MAWTKTSTWRDYYEAGLATGSDWFANYRPGGPWCVRDSYRYPDSSRRDAENAKMWFMGFDKGTKRNARRRAVYERLTAT